MRMFMKEDTIETCVSPVSIVKGFVYLISSETGCGTS